MLRLQSVSLCAVLAATISMQFVAVNHRQRLEAASRQTYGRYTQQQAIELAAPICRAMLPQTSDLFVSAEPKDISGRDGKTHRFWRVECGDSANPTIANVVRDAETGQILTASHETTVDLSRIQTHSLTASSAAARARDWMRILDASRTWHVAANPHHIFTSWQLELKAHDRSALITIDDAKGQLLFASIR